MARQGRAAGGHGGAIGVLAALLVSGGVGAQTPSAPAVSTAAAPGNAAPAAREWRYTVAAGDTLISLAAVYLEDSDAWPALQALNQVADPRRLVPGSTLRFPFDWLKREATLAQVVFVQGQVSLQRLGEPERLPVSVGMPVRPADTLRTGAQSSVSLRFADGSRLLIVPDSQLTVEDMVVYGRTGLNGTRLRIDHGSADTRVVPNAPKAPAFEVTTPAMNLGVRGTDFRVRVEPDGASARLEVLAGQVDAAGRTAASGPTQAEPNTLSAAPRAESPPAAVAVEAGQGTVAEKDRPVAPPVPLLPAPTLTPPRQLARLALAWAPVDGARGYRAQVFADGRPEALLLDRRIDAPALEWDDDLPDGAYLFKLRALDAAGLEGLDAQVTIPVALRPPAPAPVSPPAGQVLVGAEVAVGWQPVERAQSYRLQVAAGGEFDRPVAEQAAVGTTATLALPPGTYAWRIAGVLGDGPQARVGPYGEAQWFDLRPAPPRPTWEEPQLSPTRLLLRWRAEAPGQGVLLQVARDAAFRDLIVDQRTWASQWQLPRPSAGTYHLRLRSWIGEAAVGEFVAERILEVPAIAWWERWAADAEPEGR